MVALQYISYQLHIEPYVGVIPVPEPLSGACLAFQRGPKPFLSTLRRNGQITLELRTTSLVRYLLRKKATFAKTLVRG